MQNKQLSIALGLLGRHFYDRLRSVNVNLHHEFKRSDVNVPVTYLVRMSSLIHPDSSESVSSQLDLFSVPPTQTSLETGFFTKYRPLSVLTSQGPVEFCIAAESLHYIDLANTFLYVRASVTQANGAALEENSEIAPVCNFLHTLWSQCDLYLNDTLVTQSGNNYPYRSYLETLLSFGKDAKDSQLQ